MQVDLKTSNGSTALHNAANCGHSAVVKQLLQAGAGVGQCALTGANALFNAATAGHTECVEVLLDAGSIVDAVTTSGSTADSDSHDFFTNLSTSSNNPSHLLHI